jgi:threonine dehydrogenase-like Zn-dependent dehydrogenase
MKTIHVRDKVWKFDTISGEDLRRFNLVKNPHGMIYEKSTGEYVGTSQDYFSVDKEGNLIIIPSSYMPPSDTGLYVTVLGVICFIVLLFRINF